EMSDGGNIQQLILALVNGGERARKIPPGYLSIQRPPGTEQGQSGISKDEDHQGGGPHADRLESGAPSHGLGPSPAEKRGGGRSRRASVPIAACRDRET